MQASYPMIESVPVKQTRRKRRVSAYIMMTNVVLGDEILPVVPDQNSLLYVIPQRGSYQYYTYEALQNIAEIENWKLQYVGYALALDGKIHLYVNDPSNPEKLAEYQWFEEWRKYAEERLANAFNKPQTVPEVETVVAQSAVAIPTPMSFRPYLISLLLIVLTGNLAQIVIAIVK
jgi:hypothetical protein